MRSYSKRCVYCDEKEENNKLHNLHGCSNLDEALKDDEKIKKLNLMPIYRTSKRDFKKFDVN